MPGCGEGRGIGARAGRLNVQVCLAAERRAFKCLPCRVFNLTNVIKAGVGARIIHLLQMEEKKLN